MPPPPSTPPSTPPNKTLRASKKTSQSKDVSSAAMDVDTLANTSTSTKSTTNTVIIRSKKRKVEGENSSESLDIQDTPEAKKVKPSDKEEYKMSEDFASITRRLWQAESETEKEDNGLEKKDKESRKKDAENDPPTSKQKKDVQPAAV